MKRSALAVLFLTLVGATQAQVSQRSTELLQNPLFSQAKAGAAGTYTLPDGSRLVVREKAGFLLGGTILVPYTPVPVDRTLSPAALTAAQAKAQKSFARAGELTGALTGYGANLGDALTAYLARADVTPKLAEGLPASAPPYALSMRARAGVLTIDVTLSKLAVASLPVTANVLPAKKPGATPLVLRVFSDFQCPFCKQFEEQVYPSLLKTLPQDVQVEFFHLPLESIHPVARPAAEASECAAQQGKFWPFKDALFANSAWINGNPNTQFITIAGQLGINDTAFRTCLAERGGKAVVDAQLKAAQTLGLNSTPSIFVNGYRVGNPFDLNSFTQLFEFARAVDGPNKR